MLWVRDALLGLRPWLKLSDIYAHHMESPGTKAYSVAEARQLFSAFKEVQTQTLLSHGDLLESNAGQRHRGGLLTLARKIWPRWLIRRLFPYAGIFMLIEARKCWFYSAFLYRSYADLIVPMLRRGNAVSDAPASQALSSPVMRPWLGIGVD